VSNPQLNWQAVSPMLPPGEYDFLEDHLQNDL